MTNKESSGPHFPVKGVFGFGCALAIAISWSVNKSIAAAILHGLLSWAFVVWYALSQS